MNAEIYQVSGAQFLHLLGDCPDPGRAEEAAKLASDIIVGMYNSRPVCFIGLQPPTILSSSAYIWLIITEWGSAHPYIIGKYSRGIIDTFLLKYPHLYGHCFSASSARWLKYLGAEFTSETEFEIRRK